MTFFNDFFPRKKQQPVVASDGLSELQSVIDMRSAQLHMIEAEVGAADSQLAEIAGLAANLKINLSEGDLSATASLDSLEREETAIRRVREGTLSRIATLQAELAPLNARAVQLARDRERRRQDDLVADAKNRAEEQFNELSGLWLRTCCAAFDLMNTLAGPAPGGLDPEHLAAFRAIRNHAEAQLQQLRLSLVNEQWHVREPGRFDLRIVPAIPVRPREIAKVS